MTTRDRTPPERAFDDDDITSRLLRLAGPREDADTNAESRVYLAVLAEARAVARRRRAVRRLVTAAAGLAMAAAAVLAVRLWNPDTPAAARRVGQVMRIEGAARLLSAGDARRAQDASMAMVVHAGDVIETSQGSRMGLRLDDGASVRFDTGSRARLAAPLTIELTRGAVYVDNPAGARGIEIATPLGTIRDVGTQFEVRLGPSTLHVRVRSGRVALKAGGRDTTGGPGTELMLAGDTVATRPMAIHGDPWAWTTALAPAIPIDGRAVAAVLEDICREHGWALEYASAELAREAARDILRGSIEGLSTEDSLAAILAANGYVHHVRNGTLVVTRATRGAEPLR